MNKIFIKGRLVREPEQRFISDEKSVTRFSLAVNRRFAKKDDEQQADFINIVAWNKIGEFAKKYFTKGQEMLVVGRLETSLYIDKESQKRLTNYQVIAEEIEFCGTKKEVQNKQDEDEDFSFDENEIVNIDFSNDENDLPF